MDRLIRTTATKLSSAEYEALLRVASSDGKTVSTWLRELILDALQDEKYAKGEHVLLAEILALRAITVNLLFAIGANTTFTQQTVNSIMDAADRNKLTRAIARTTSKKES